MSDIREYRKLHNNMHMVKNTKGSESAVTFEGDVSQERALKRHYKRKITISIICALLIVLAVVIYFVVTEAIGYSEYSIVWSIGREEGSPAKYTEYGNGFLKYSSDGIIYYDSNGKIIWNHTYTMKNPSVNICGDKIAVADIDGSAIMIYDRKGYISSVDTALVIRQVLVSENGLVVAVLEDKAANYINMFDSEGNKVYSIKTTLTGDGYPMDIAITSNGMKLMASFLYVSGESVKTNVVFYNFSEIGQNETERLVGGFNHYDSSIVPEVEFLTDKRAIAIGEHVLSIYSMNEYPKLSDEIAVDGTIEKVFYSEDYIGIVTQNNDSTYSHLLTVYNSNGSRKFSLPLTTSYEHMKFDSRGVMMYNTDNFMLVNMSGHELYNGSLDMAAEDILSTGSRGRYILIGTKYIQKLNFH